MIFFLTRFLTVFSTKHTTFSRYTYFRGRAKIYHTVFGDEKIFPTLNDDFSKKNTLFCDDQFYF